MSIITFAFPVVYTALYFFAVLFLLKTKNEKFYQKILFAVFVCSAATWGWAELLQNMEELRSMAHWFTKIAFASALLPVEVLLLICLEILNLRFSLKRYWYFYFLLPLLPIYSFIPGFIIQGFTEVDNYLAIIAGYADFFYTNLIILTSSLTLFLFLLVFNLSDQTTRKRVSPIILAFILTLISGVFFNIFLPVSFNNEAFTSFAPLSMGTVVVALAYSIFKWNLLGIAFNERVSYSQINQMWKSNDEKIHDQVREVFKQVAELVGDQRVEVKKIVFLGGVMNLRGGGVDFYNPLMVNSLFFFYSFLALFNPKIRHISRKDLTKVTLVFKKIPKDFNLGIGGIKILELFSSLTFYQRSTESALSSYVKSKEGIRLI